MENLWVLFVLMFIHPTITGFDPTGNLSAWEEENRSNLFVKLERDSVFWETTQDGRIWEANFNIIQGEKDLEVLRPALGLTMVPEASDE